MNDATDARDRKDRTLLLKDGRTLSFTVSGTEDAHPVIYLHGIPDSRRQPIIPPELSGQLRIIAPDRPGYGGSSPCAHYSFTDHTADIIALTDHLGLDRFSLFGFSAGGVFAMACAVALGEHVQRLVLTGTPAVPLLYDHHGTAGELTGETWRLALEDPDSLAAALTPLATETESLVGALMKTVSAADHTLLTDPVVQPLYQETITTAIAQGPKVAATAMARDLMLTVRPWGFNTTRLRQPTLIYQGFDDGWVYPIHAHTLATHMPSAELMLGDGQGHYSAIYGSGAVDAWRRTLLSP